jgi:glucose/arabinose dehydrogenase
MDQARFPPSRMLRLSALAYSTILVGCHGAGPRTDPELTTRDVDVADVGLPEGYRLTVVTTGLTFPSCVFLGEDGSVHVVESGYCYGEAFATPRILRITEEGGTEVVAQARANADEDPRSAQAWTGAVQYDGHYLVASNGIPTRILRVRNGGVEVLVDGLPSLADHHLNPPVVGPDGWIYFGQGSATNAGVVGVDNAKFGWLERTPQVHDVPAQDLVSAGREFETEDPLGEGEDDVASTGAYAPFGSTNAAGDVIVGSPTSTGVIYRVQPESGQIEIHASGLRNPFGLEFHPDGSLYAVENAFDERGSRPVYGAPDCIWRIDAGRWYGWPDFCAGIPLTHPRFDGGDGPPGFLLAEHPETPPRPAALLPVHSSGCGIAIARNDAFGPANHAYVAQFGDMSPGVGTTYGRVGFDVLRVDLTNGVSERFLTNLGDENGPASALRTNGIERPVDVCFDASGNSLYVLDFGIVEDEGGKIVPRPGTGTLFEITRETAR